MAQNAMRFRQSSPKTRKPRSLLHPRPPDSASRECYREDGNRRTERRSNLELTDCSRRRVAGTHDPDAQRLVRRPGGPVFVRRKNSRIPYMQVAMEMSPALSSVRREGNSQRVLQLRRPPLPGGRWLGVATSSRKNHEDGETAWAAALRDCRRAGLTPRIFQLDTVDIFTSQPR